MSQLGCDFRFLLVVEMRLSRSEDIALNIFHNDESPSCTRLCETSVDLWYFDGSYFSNVGHVLRFNTVDTFTILHNKVIVNTILRFS